MLKMYMEAILSILILVVTVFLFFYIMSGPPYLPSKIENIEKIIRLAEIKPGQKVVDLGSGDGRIVIALAKIGAEAHGVEINPALVWLSRKNIKKAGLQAKSFIHMGSFWRQDFSSFDVVIIYGMSHIMKRLEKKLQHELKPGSRVICSVFQFPNWQCEKKDGTAHLYVKK